MEIELKELEEKIEKLGIFLEKETKEPKFTDEEQRINLHLQKNYMKNYAEILHCRIYYDTLKAHGEIDNSSNIAHDSFEYEKVDN